MNMRMRIARLLAAPCLFGALVVPVTATVTPQPAATPAAGRDGGFAQPATALGSGWASSGDELVTATGDSGGYHVMVASEQNAFAWKNLVTLTAPSDDVGPYTGEICTTGDGKYAVAVYAPSASTNTPALVEAGSFVAVINLATGKAIPVAARVQLAYYDPGCGLGDTAVLTRALGTGEQRSQLVDVDAATGKITAVTTVSAQVTNAFHSDGGDIGIVGGSLARIGPSGSVTRFARLAGEAYAVVPTSDGIDTVSASGGHAVVQRWTGTRLQTLGTGKLTELGLYPQAGGGDLLVGDTTGIRADSGTRLLAGSRVPDAVSRQGDLIATQVVSEEVQAIQTKQVGAATPSELAGRIRISATATRTRTSVSAVVPASGPVSETMAGMTTAAAAQPVAGPRAASLAAAASGYVDGGANPAATSDYEAAVDLSNSTDGGAATCLVPRNSPTDQALQPTAAMVEWAVDQAVHGTLDVDRGPDYLSTGQAEYQPQVMFPPVVLDGPAGTIPAQVELGILAQESNFDEASWHAVPGDSGNPLIADYYGTAAATGTADNPDVVPDYDASDCGYGIGQVTDEMSSLDSSQLSTADATAVATDYAANIAASVQILSKTWNQLATMSPALLVNGGDPNYIENWFLAIWGYNSGVYPQADASANGGYGVGWYNNPANPQYPADRAMFNDNVTTSNDAAQPQLWSYEEKVMGWIEHPQIKGTTAEYAQPNFGSGEVDPNYGGATVSGPGIDMPGHYEFCSTSVNACDSSEASDPCPDDDGSCWWSQPVTWISSENSTTAATEALSYGLGSSEPAMDAQYPADCPNETDFRDDLPTGTMIVTDLNDPLQNTRGCAWLKSDGKFTIRLGDNIALSSNQGGAMQANPMSAQIDLHQIGAGFLGHFYFTHTYDLGSHTDPLTGDTDAGEQSATTTVIPADPDDASDPGYTTYATVPAQVQHEVTGTWIPGIPSGTTAQSYAIIAAIPDHGANAADVTYHIDHGFTDSGQLIDSTVDTCEASQPSDGNTWMFLGTYTLGPGADVWLNNMVPGATGTSDVAFSSVIFMPTDTAYACGDDVPYITSAG